MDRVHLSLFAAEASVTPSISRSRKQLRSLICVALAAHHLWRGRGRDGLAAAVCTSKRSKRSVQTRQVSVPCDSYRVVDSSDKTIVFADLDGLGYFDTAGRTHPCSCHPSRRLYAKNR